MKLLGLFLLFSFSLIHARPLNEIVKSEVINIAIRKSPAIYYINQNITNGFPYTLSKEYADYLGVKHNYIFINTLSDYFKKDGSLSFYQNTFTTNAKEYNPDVFQNVDMIADILTITPNRKYLFNMIPYIQNKEVIFTHKELSISNVHQLNKKKIILIQNSSFIEAVKSFEKSKNIQFEYYLIDNKKEITALDMIQYIYQKKAECGIIDSMIFISYLQNDPYLNSFIQPITVLTEGFNELGFAFPKNEPEISHSFSNFIKELKKTDRYNKLFKNSFGMDYEDYVKLLELK